jgi:hypothetical protein
MTRNARHQSQDRSPAAEQVRTQGGGKTTSHKTDVPQLLIVPADALILHEDVDARRVEPLIKRLRTDGLLKNPPVAAPVEPSRGQGDRRYVILDGANRTTALWKLGAPHHLVQLVDYRDVELDTWGHLVAGIPQEVFAQSLAKTGLRLDVATAQAARQRLACREIAASIANPGGDVLTLLAGASETGALRRLTAVYNGQSIIHRVTTDNLAELLPYHEDVAALIRFPCYTPAEILHLASNGHKLPTGITRHVIPGRALRVNLPLSVLMDEARTTEGKNEWLRAWISHKLTGREIRYYQESTFLFDE